MKRLLQIIALCLLMTSCDTNINNKPANATQERTAMAEERAHSHGCMTLEEFVSMRYTYVIEKQLPCRVYVESFNIHDIIPRIKESTVYVWADCDGCEGEDEGEVKYDVLPDWVGTPTNRVNECWIDGYYFHSYFQGVSGYVGLDKTQVEWAVEKAMDSDKYRNEVKAPIIIRIDQVRKDGGISIKADLVQILNEE